MLQDAGIKQPLSQPVESHSRSQPLSQPSSSKPPSRNQQLFVSLFTSQHDNPWEDDSHLMDVDPSVLGGGFNIYYILLFPILSSFYLCFVLLLGTEYIIQV